jgi:hypothetical protein
LVSTTRMVNQVGRAKADGADFEKRPHPEQPGKRNMQHGEVSGGNL